MMKQKRTRKGAVSRPGTARFSITIENRTKYPMEPGYLIVPPKAWFRTEELKVFDPGTDWTWTLDHVPESVTITGAKVLVGPNDAPALESRALPDKKVDLRGDAVGVTVRYGPDR